MEKLKRATPLSDRHFTIIVSSDTSFNTCEKTLHSILEQTYQNFSVFYIDNGSEKTTSTILKQWQESGKLPQLSILQNREGKALLQNLYETIYLLGREEVVLFLSGDSWLCNKEVLHTLNKWYKTYAVWALCMPYQKSIDKTTSHLPLLFSSCLRRVQLKEPFTLCFYAGLFQKIAVKDLFFKGGFLGKNSQEAYLFPMLEMAQNHAAFLSFPCCYKLQDPLINVSYRKDKSFQKISKISPYKPLKQEPLEKTVFLEEKADLLVFSYDRPLQLYAFLESARKQVKDIEAIYVLYRTSKERFEKGYDLVKKRFPHVHYIKQSVLPHLDFQPMVQKILFEISKSPYLFFSVDDVLVKDSFEVKEAIYHLEKTKAYCFSFRLGKNIRYCYMGGFSTKVPQHLSLGENMLAWHIDAARGDWTYPNSLDMTLYRKKDLEKVFSSIFFKNPNQLEWNWHRAQKIRREKKEWIGLCYTFSKAVNIPLNIVNPSANRNMNLFTPEELLQKLEKGFCFDIAPLYQVKNRAVHMEYEPTFIPLN